MKTFKTFRQLREFEDIGSGEHIFDREIAKDAAMRHSTKKARDNFKSHMNADPRKDPPNLTPKDLKKHQIKKLSSDPDHKEYTVHHVGSGSHRVAILHHKTDGFVGMISGHKLKSGLNVHESFLSKNHRGKGLGTSMYEHTAKHYGAVVSDTLLSTHSQRIYAHFAKQGRVVSHNHSPYRDKGEEHNNPVTATPKGSSKLGKYNFSTPTSKNLAKDNLIGLKILPKAPKSKK